MQKTKILSRINKLERLLNLAVAREAILREDLSRWRACGPYDVTRLFSHENDILLKIARINSIQRRIVNSFRDQLYLMFKETEFKPLENEPTKYN